MELDKIIKLYLVTCNSQSIIVLCIIYCSLHVAYFKFISKNTKIIIGIIIVIAIIAIGYSISNKQPAEPVSQEPIKIGFIGPMSGQAAAYGDYVKRAFQLGVDEWNTDNNLKIEAIYEDGKCAPADAVSAANKLINVDRVNFIMTFCTGETNAVVPVTEGNKVVLLTAGTTAPNIAKGQYVFRNIGSVGSGLPALTKLAYESNKEIALISENTDYAASSKEGFKQKYSALGGKVLFDESFDAKNLDFKTIISKLKSNNISAIFVVVQSLDNSASLFKQMKELDYHPRIFATEGAISDKALDKYKTEGYLDMIEGTIFVQPYFDKENYKAKHLLSLYEAKYGTTKGPIPESYLATHYDAVYLIGEAVSNIGTNPDSVKEYFLNKIKSWDGAVGKFSFDETGDAVVVIQVNIVKNGEIVPLEN